MLPSILSGGLPAFADPASAIRLPARLVESDRHQCTCSATNRCGDVVLSMGWFRDQGLEEPISLWWTPGHKQLALSGNINRTVHHPYSPRS